MTEMSLVASWPAPRRWIGALRRGSQERRGVGLIDGVLALSLIVVSLMPILELVRSSAGSIRARQSDMAVRGLLADLMEKIGAEPWTLEKRLPGLEAGRQASLDDVLALLREPDGGGGLGQDLEETLRRTAVSFRISRESRDLTPEEAGTDGTDLEVWLVTANWSDCGQRREQATFRIRGSDGR